MAGKMETEAKSFSEQHREGRQGPKCGRFICKEWKRERRLVLGVWSEPEVT